MARSVVVPFPVLYLYTIAGPLSSKAEVVSEDEKFELYKKKEKRDFTRLDFVFFFLQIMLHISIYIYREASRSIS